MTIIPDPVITTMEFDEHNKIHRIIVKDKKVFDFDLSERWLVSKVSVTEDKNTLVITLEKREE